jgi:GWxTD domain-containing protein
MRTLSRGFAVVVLSLMALNVHAALSQKYIDWANGPAKWLFTRDDQKAWNAIQSDDQAQHFMDLFWARRDPTPGTLVNEYRDEFESRVKYADEHYGQRGARGAMTDRGRALIVLGWPNMAGSQFGGSKMGRGSGTTADDVFGANQNELGGGRLGSRDEWTYEHAEAQKYNMPRIYIVFIQDPISGIWQRDTQRPDFVTANLNAVKLAVHNPELTEVPDWARPKLLISQIEQTKKLSQQAAAPAAPAVEPGVRNLVLVKDVMSVGNAQDKSNPFARATSAASFGKGDDLGYAFQYCGTADTVKLTITISGMSGGQKVRMTAPADEVAPDPLRAVPGCGMIRASIPLSDLTLQPGTYNFAVKVEDGPASYNLAQDFKIE